MDKLSKAQKAVDMMSDGFGSLEKLIGTTHATSFLSYIFDNNKELPLKDRMRARLVQYWQEKQKEN